MRVVLVACNARYTHSSLALRWLRQAIEGEPCPAGGTWDIVLREYPIGLPRLKVTEDITALQPEVLLISMHIWDSAYTEALLPDLRALLPDCRMILGGPEPSWRADELLARHPEIDLLVRGPGEAVTGLLARYGFDLVRAIVACPEAFDASGPRTAEGVPRIAALATDDFTALPSPWRAADFSELADRYVYHETSRGCPFACAYCLSAREDEALQLKPAALACAELDAIAVHRPMLVKLVDRTFNADPGRARTIWRHLIENDNAYTRWHFEVHPALLEAEDYLVLARARPGLFQFEIGVQSVNPKALAAVGRAMDWERCEPAVARLIGLGTIHVHLDLIAGLPHEGLADIGRSFDRVLALRPDHFQLGFLKVLPGSPIAERAEGLGIVHQHGAPYEILSAPWLPAAELAELRRVEDLLDAVWNSGAACDLVPRDGKEISAFAWFRDLARRAAASGYDTRTRQASKVRAFVEGLT